MKRRSSNRQTQAVSMFPFLAVLLCTMGSLIVLLIVLSQQQAPEVAAKPVEEPGPVVTAEDHAEELKKLKAQLALVRREQQEVDSTLAEERQSLSHIENHTRQLAAELEQMQRALDEMARMQLDAQAADAEQLRQQMAAAVEEQARLEQLLAEAAEQDVYTNYAIVPYEGHNETLRRPLYIECRSDAIILQPEGVRLNEADFMGPMGPGNALAAAIRAANEHLALSSGGVSTGEAYPFLLIRPDGIGAYYVARSALKSWGSEFGYELVEADWELAYPPADPTLAEVETAAVELARARQEQLVRMAPRRYSGGPEMDFSGQRAAAQAAAASGTAGGGGGAWKGLSGREGGGGSLEESDNTDPSQNQPEGKYASQDPAAEMDASQDGKEGGSAEEKSKGKAGSPGGNANQQPAQSLASRRGRDWALPGKSRGSIPVSRPIQVRCGENELVLLPEDPRRQEPRVIPLEHGTLAAVDELVSAVWEHIEGWGIAGNGMHWKPILVVEPLANSTARVQELEVLLADSGLEVKSRQSTATAPAAVPNQVPR